jgi:hypothetical protein
MMLIRLGQYPFIQRARDPQYAAIMDAQPKPKGKGRKNSRSSLLYKPYMSLTFVYCSDSSALNPSSWNHFTFDQYLRGSGRDAKEMVLFNT